MHCIHEPKSEHWTQMQILNFFQNSSSQICCGSPSKLIILHTALIVFTNDHLWKLTASKISCHWLRICNVNNTQPICSSSQTRTSKQIYYRKKILVETLLLEICVIFHMTERISWLVTWMLRMFIDEKVWGKRNKVCTLYQWIFI